jgi:hypothetical protein
MRRIFTAVTSLTLALVLMGGLWPERERDGGSDGRLAAVRVPLGLESRTARAIERDVITWTGLLRHNDRQVFFRGDVGCTQGQQLRMTIRIVQGDAEGRGQLVERCTGELESIEVRVIVRGPHTFTVGEEAEYWVRAGSFHRGTMTDEHTSEGRTELHPEGDDPRHRIG